MKALLPILLLAAALAVAPSAVHAGNKNSSTARTAKITTTSQIVPVIYPYLQNPGPDGITILWRPHTLCRTWVDYGPNEKLGKTQPSESVDPGDPRSPYRRARLTGLQPGKKYFYRVGFARRNTTTSSTSASYELSDIYHFTLPSPDQERVTCCVLNDIHNVYPSFQAVAPFLRSQSPDCVFFNGDLFNNPPSEDFAIEGLQIYNAGVEAASRPVFYLRGNHDARGAYGPKLPRHFENPGKKLYFAWTVGPVRFVALDCGDEKAPESYKLAQDAWLKEELESEAFQSAQYRIVLYHIPIYGKMFNDDYKKRWDTLFRHVPIDAAISAHIHMPQIIMPEASGAPHPVVIGGGRSNPTVIVLRAGNKACRIELYDKNAKRMDAVELRRH